MRYEQDLVLDERIRRKSEKISAVIGQSIGLLSTVAGGIGGYFLGEYIQRNVGFLKELPTPVHYGINVLSIWCGVGIGAIFGLLLGAGAYAGVENVYSAYMYKKYGSPTHLK